MPVALLSLATACGRPSEPARLVLDGPAEVHVTALGPVDGPEVRLADGTVPEGLIWTVSRPGVARVDGDTVVAQGPGHALIAAEWEGERVSWALDVELQTVVTFVDPPSVLRVGERHPLPINAVVAEQPVETGPIHWSSSARDVIEVDSDGIATGMGPGTAWITAETGGANAMVEIEVVR
jgi:hypothetical protein